MNRRLFIGTALLSFTLPTEILAASDSQVAANMVFFDPRFAKSLPELGDRVRTGNTRIVNGDITPVWNDGLKRLSGKVTLNLVGVTTDSFYFCLQRLLQEKNTVTAESLKINSNLVAWMITSQNRRAKTEMS